jgi:hypothetical protein
MPGATATVETRRWFAEVCGILAEHAAGRMVRLCVGHAAQTLLPTPVETVAFLDELRAPAGLLLDAAECPAPGAWVAALGPRLTCLRLSCPPMAVEAWVNAWMSVLHPLDFRGHVVFDWNAWGASLG